MSRIKSIIGRGGLLVFGASPLVGCSLLEDIRIDQCQTTADCTKLGPDFAGTICEASLCVTPGSTDPGSGGQTAMGTGGEPAVAECEDNGDCIDANFGSPFICRSGECLALQVPGECPVVLGAGQNNENLRKPDPIIFGAYSFVDPTAPRLSVPTLNYELAIDEVNEETNGGIPGGSDGTRRPFIAVVCSGSNSPDLETSLGHLIDDLKVPAIISSLYTRDLVEAFETKGGPSSTFFLSPLEADTNLIQLEDDGLLWHMLAPANDLSPAYVPLVERAEAYVRSTHPLETSMPVRVALVESKTPFLSDIADDAVASVQFNGKSAIANQTDDNFLRIRVDSSLEVPTPDLSSALSQLQAFQPHIVLALTSGEFVATIQSLEAQWNPAWGSRPFYLVSPYMFARDDLASLSGIHGRMLGVNFAGADDSTLYDLYYSKLDSTYDVTFSLEGSENFYDAAYFLMYAIVGAGEPPKLTGHEVALGMARLINGKIEFNVGSRDANDVIGTLRGNPGTTISLQGTMGPPDFNSSTGARHGLPSIYCINGGAKYVQNAMSYEPATNSLTGTPTCVSGF